MTVQTEAPDRIAGPRPVPGTRATGQPGPGRVPERPSGPGLFRFLAWTNVLIGASAAAFTWVTALAVDLPGDPLVAAFVFLFVVATHTRDRLQPTHDGSRRAAWMARRRRPLIWWTAGCTAALLPLAVLRPWCAAALATVGVMGWFYAVPLVRWRGLRRAPRQLPCVKLPYTMIGWALIAVVLPAAQLGALDDPRVWWLALAGVLIGGVTTLVNDLRDVAADRRDGSLTLPVVIGEGRTRALAHTMALCGALVGQLVFPGPVLLWALFNSTILSRYRPRPGEHPAPWGDAQGLVLLGAVLLTR
ncbi:UbiA family prenyltransferase [Streptomyces sp. NPDC090025]|uniref:UbiA family prenyltransferase n=1 Tax=Streptomyces sp. NPDC090025 TaxID=3365922 RepID=UPI00383401F7